MDAEPWGDGPALEAHRPIESPRDPREREGGEGLSKLIGRSRALEILGSGKEVRALDALRLGIVDHLAAPGVALDQANALAATFASKPRAAVKAIKRALTEGDEKPYRNRFLLESQHAVQLLWSDDYKAAMQKLRDKR